MNSRAARLAIVLAFVVVLSALTAFRAGRESEGVSCARVPAYRCDGEPASAMSLPAGTSVLRAHAAAGEPGDSQS